MARKARSTVVVVDKKPARKISVSISGDSGEVLDQYCTDEDRTPSWTINKLIERYLDKLRRNEL